MGLGGKETGFSVIYLYMLSFSAYTFFVYHEFRVTYISIHIHSNVLCNAYILLKGIVIEK